MITQQMLMRYRGLQLTIFNLQAEQAALESRFRKGKVEKGRLVLVRTSYKSAVVPYLKVMSALVKRHPALVKAASRLVKRMTRMVPCWRFQVKGA